MSQENVEIVRSIYMAYAQRDGLTPFKHYAPDIEWENLHWQAVGVPAVYHGHDGVRAMFHDILQAFREFEFRALEWTPNGDHVLVTVHEHGVGRMSGVVVDRRHYAAWTLHDGMVTRVCVYLDHADALKAAGLADG